MMRGKLANGALPAANPSLSGGDDIDVERLAGGARFLGAIQHGQVLCRLGEGGKEMFNREGPIEMDLEHAHFFAALREVLHGFLRGFGAGAHHDDHALRIRGAHVVKQVVVSGPPRSRTCP